MQFSFSFSFSTITIQFSFLELTLKCFLHEDYFLVSTLLIVIAFLGLCLRKAETSLFISPDWELFWFEVVISAQGQVIFKMASCCQHVGVQSLSVCFYKICNSEARIFIMKVPPDVQRRRHAHRPGNANPSVQTQGCQTRHLFQISQQAN